MRGFWSPNGGVGSNPTPDSSTFCQHVCFETIPPIVCFKDYLEKEFSFVKLLAFNIYLMSLEGALLAPLQTVYMAVLFKTQFSDLLSYFT